MIVLNEMNAVMEDKDTTNEEKVGKLNDIIKSFISTKFSSVGDLSSHPIIEEMAKITIGMHRVS